MNFFDELKTKLQEHNSSRVNSQKENMMQATQLKQNVNAELPNKSFNPVLVQQIETEEAKAVKAAELIKTQSFNRFLEAFGDCV